MPIAPWVYIHDATPGAPYLHTLQARLPAATCFELGVHSSDDSSSLLPAARMVARILLGELDQRVVLIRGNEGTLSERVRTSNALKTAAIKHGCNFASVNISASDNGTTDLEQWGTNHLEVKAEDVDATTEKIFKWLCMLFWL